MNCEAIGYGREMMVDRAEIIKIIENYGAVLEELSRSGQLCVYDERHLLHPKSVIRNALYFQLREYSYEAWQKIEGRKETYNSLLTGLFSLVMFQRDLGEWQIRIPYLEEDDLTRLDKNHASSLIKLIDSILDEIRETCEKIMKLKIPFDVNGEIDQNNTARVILLYFARQKLKHHI
jgi:hypothetical protein